jgi:hypothetical protein
MTSRKTSPPAAPAPIPIAVALPALRPALLINFENVDVAECDHAGRFGQPAFGLDDDAFVVHRHENRTDPFTTRDPDPHG